MKPSKAVKNIVLTLAGATLLFGLVACKDVPHDSHARMERIFEFVAYKLDFNDEQKAILEQTKMEFIRIKEQRVTQSKQRADTLISLIEADSLDTEQLSLLMEQRHQRIKEQSPRIRDFMVELHSTLTQEQKKNLIQLISQRLNQGELHSTLKQEKKQNLTQLINQRKNQVELHSTLSQEQKEKLIQLINKRHKQG